jgi:integrase
MNVKELSATTVKLLERLEHDGYSQGMMGEARWILGHFAAHCASEGIEEIDMGVISAFLLDKYGIDYENTVTPMQTVLRRPLLVLMEFYESGNYVKHHQKGVIMEVPSQFEDLFLAYRGFVDGTGICVKTRKRKLWAVANYLKYLGEKGIEGSSGFHVDDASGYMATLQSYSRSTRRVISGVLREMFEWLFANGVVPFSGRDVFPMIRKCPKGDIMSYYSKDEIEAMLDSIDTTSRFGKTAYFIFSITAFLGIRAGDLINLKLSDIDFENNRIGIIQQKTGEPVTWPLIDEVKFPLLDYLKNARHDCDDKDHVLITANAPYTAYSCTSAVWKAVSGCVERAGFADKGRHRGPHALRHSLATNLMRENVPLSAISSVLGHASTRTTEAYLSIDETHLKELTLEVPHGA